MGHFPRDLNERMAQAIAQFWVTRRQQLVAQGERGTKDQGARGAVTGGAQMDGVISILIDIIASGGVTPENIHVKTQLELPGFFRPTKEWDLLVIRGGQLIAVVEAKSHVGPSFGNNFNNRTEEAMGSALDLWTAYREGAFNLEVKPWLGYLLLLEDCTASSKPVRCRSVHFPVLPEFENASYAVRYELFCRKLVRERHYNAAAFFTSRRDSGEQGIYQEPAADLSLDAFARSLWGHVSAFGGGS